MGGNNSAFGNLQNLADNHVSFTITYLTVSIKNTSLGLKKLGY